ncbi:MAG: hypothetical protein E7773_11180 [Sphingomonas sp.]|uniref:hypothetical protein n=1 Tax=Sphingomonas sp. TaxID=28214 RepID=UPI00121F05E7|nr:hypothetical protein [Sphingomonas sp.]THD35023.1 MAG: hypothetical protein E7773_11180 [Sphingomonas sp.]
MKTILAVLFATMPTLAFAQSAIEHYAWQDPRPLVPLSRTAQAITGPVRVRPQSITFNGKVVRSRLVGKWWREWDDTGKKSTASVYALSSDPGALRQGNTLCGAGAKARFVVLWQSYQDGVGGAVNMSVWSSATKPEDKDSPGLCGTYSYVWNVR